MAFSTGMRRGELLGLRWEDIDMDKGLVHIRQNSVCVNGKMIQKNPKSRKSKSIVTMSPSIIPILQKHQEETGIKTGLVFSYADGKRLHPGSIKDWFNPT